MLTSTKPLHCPRLRFVRHARAPSAACSPDSPAPGGSSESLAALKPNSCCGAKNVAKGEACCSSSSSSKPAAPAPDAVTSAAMSSLEARYLGGDNVALSREDLQRAFSEPGPASARRAGKSEAFLDVAALLAEARAAGGETLVFSDDGLE